ncbi:hypothetical protein [Nostoc commune]|uniref:hypothetical protein n=1 Tax=Nostoc commune TaxID=1178 RepID=UPI0018C620E0|nr:hypothetical protein [Nostoc commune]MBG1263687.1 hypothetical protein [Nostoc commune BAE]
MERLRFFDLSFCENEVSDLNQVQGGQLETGLAVSFNTANRSNFDSNFSVVRTGLNSANILASGASGATGVAVAGAATFGGAAIGVFASTSATAS